MRTTRTSITTAGARVRSQELIRRREEEKAEEKDSCEEFSSCQGSICVNIVREQVQDKKQCGLVCKKFKCAAFKER